MSTVDNKVQIPQFPTNYTQLRAKRMALMLDHNNLTKELLALDVEMSKLSKATRHAT